MAHLLVTRLRAEVSCVFVRQSRLLPILELEAPYLEALL
jgi:hypothetical protein